MQICAAGEKDCSTVSSLLKLLAKKGVPKDDVRCQERREEEYLVHL